MTSPRAFRLGTPSGFSLMAYKFFPNEFCCLRLHAVHHIGSGGNRRYDKLEFVYNHNNDFWRLDDINVSAQGVPEAFSTIWLALPAFGALGMLHFSRARTRKSFAHI